MFLDTNPMFFNVIPNTYLTDSVTYFAKTPVSVNKKTIVHFKSISVQITILKCFFCTTIIELFRTRVCSDIPPHSGPGSKIIPIHIYYNRNG